MGLRDILLFIVVFGGIPFILRHPYIGVMYWVWLGMMNPHRLGWGAAIDFPFAQVTALATLAGLVFTRDERRFKGGPEVFFLIAFVVWMSVTTLFALNPHDAPYMWQRVIKIQVMGLVALVLLNSKQHIQLLMWVLVLSMGFYGVKGGLFTISGGGQDIVWGPPGSFVEDNNALALALVMTIPLMYYLFQVSPKRWIKLGLAGAMILCAAAALGSQSRGALLAIGAMSFYMWLKSPGKLLSGMVLVLAGFVLLGVMPEKWWDRMGTITNYEQDASAMGRINAWYAAYNIAVDRPALGAGFELSTPEVFARYAPNPTDVHAAHSIYFQVLGEHGFVGLSLFLLMWWFTWRRASQILKTTKGQEEWRWAGRLAAMIQVSLVGYAVGGAFLSLAYWDLPYYELVILVVTSDLIKRSVQQKATEEREQQRATRLRAQT